MIAMQVRSKVRAHLLASLKTFISHNLRFVVIGGANANVLIIKENIFSNCLSAILDYLTPRHLLKCQNLQS